VNTFEEWVRALPRQNDYVHETDVLARLQWMWRDYCHATFETAQPKVALPSSHLDEKVQSIFNAQAGNPTQKGKLTAAQLSAFSQQLIASYRKDNIPDTDNDTLCIYHAFSHASAVPEQQRSALVLCTQWKTERIVADLAYDDDRCVKNMALKYGFTKWSPMKGDEILANYKTPGTELVISVYQATSKIPVKYWTDGTWHNKQFDIEGNTVLDTMLQDPGTYGHAIYARVERADLIKFFDNKNNNSKSTTQIQTNAKPLRCIIYSKPA
jgi:hypothetical protein